MAKRSLQVLFIGNSFTARNNLPALVAKLAAADGNHLDHKLISAGGASLRMHWNKGIAQKAIAEEHFDYVVLQEQSTLPVKNANRMHENVRLFDAAIKASGAKTALYMTWARRNAPQTQELITDAYTRIAQEIGAILIPAGVAWKQFLAEHTAPLLHDRDQSHPTLAGSYLAACVAYAIFFRVSPLGNAAVIEGLDQSDAAALRAITFDVSAQR
jgi:uncharacterized protein DUF4886